MRHELTHQEMVRNMRSAMLSNELEGHVYTMAEKETMRQFADEKISYGEFRNRFLQGQ